MTREKIEQLINLNPIRRGGFLSTTVKDFASKYLDGYSICDYCNGNLEEIRKPEIYRINEILQDVYEMNKSTITIGAREAMAVVAQRVLQPGDIVIVDENKHYSSVISMELAGATIVEAKSSGYPEYIINPKSYEVVIKSAPKKPALLLLTHIDGRWGNLTDVKGIAKVAKTHNIPILLNAAYSAGRFKFSGKDIDVDFISISGHKSFGSPGPVGALLYNDKWAGIIEQKSKYYSEKKLCTLGCSARGVAIAGFLQALKEIEPRLSNWDQEIKQTQYFINEMERLGNGGIKQLGQKPKQHDLVYFETPIFDEMSKTNRKHGYFLSEALKKKRIIGIKQGKTKGFKVSVYGLKVEEIEYVLNSFKEVIDGR